MGYNIQVPGADTVVIVSSERKYKLHSAQLKQCSGLFNELLLSPGAGLSSQGRKAGVRFLICLQSHDEHTNEEIRPQFRRVPLNTDGRPVRAFSQIYEGDQNNGVRPGLFTGYDKLIGSFCNRQVKLNNESIATLLHDSVGLVEVAEDLGSVRGFPLLSSEKY